MIARAAVVVLYGLSMLAMLAILATRPPETRGRRDLLADALGRFVLVGLAPIALVLLLGAAARESRRKDRARRALLRHSVRPLDLE